MLKRSSARLLEKSGKVKDAQEPVVKQRRRSVSTTLVLIDEESKSCSNLV